MPEIDGITLVRWLQQKSCSAKVLVASGVNPDYADFAETIGDENGLDITRLSKPFVLKEFSAALAPTPDTVPAIETVREPVNDLLLQAMDQPKLSKGLNF
jgi:CheY-like chemotaxis protein